MVMWLRVVGSRSIVGILLHPRLSLSPVKSLHCLYSQYFLHLASAYLGVRSVTSSSLPDWSLWSSSTTWPNGTVPGVDMPFANVTIPCGVKIVLDVPLLLLNTLVVQGWLV